MEKKSMTKILQGEMSANIEELHIVAKGLLEYETLSGHISKTQRKIGIFFIFLIKIAGIPTVIGDGSNTKMIS